MLIAWQTALSHGSPASRMCTRLRKCSRRSSGSAAAKVLVNYIVEKGKAPRFPGLIGLAGVSWRAPARPKSAALTLCKILGAGRWVSIAYVVGATHFPWVGAAIETQLATIPALTDCLPRNCPQRDAGSPTAPWELRRLAAAGAAPQAADLKPSMRTAQAEVQPAPGSRDATICLRGIFSRV